MPVADLETDRGRIFREASLLFEGKGEDALTKTVKEFQQPLAEAGIPTALIGGFALAFHGRARMTEDVNVLVPRGSIPRIHELLVGLGHVPAFPGARKALRNTRTGVRVDMIEEGEYPGDGKPKPVAFPAPGEVSEERQGIQVIGLAKLMELKLASGLTASHRARDLGDIVDLIRELGLGRDFAERLDPSVRAAFIGYLPSGEEHDPSDE